MEKSFASGESDPLSDVALAWKSLQKAKAVLQRIENKFYHQTWSCAKSQAARRKLWHEKTFDGERNRDETTLNEIKSNAIPPTHRGSFHSAPSSPARRETADGEDTAGTWSPEKSLYKPRRDDFREQADSRGHTTQKEKPLCSLNPPPHSPAWSRPFSAVPHVLPTAALPPTYHLPSTSTLRDQQLNGLWKKSPQNKLEQLKKRIQEQKQKQQAASWEQKCLISAYAKEPPQNRPLKRKVCKMVSGPPAPVYRGFSAVNMRSALSLPDEEHRIPGREEFTIPGQRRDYKKALKIPDQRERRSVRRIQKQSQRQPSPKSSVLEREATGKGANLPGPSTWREGQKLARKLLGPCPTFPNLRSTAEEKTTANTFEPDRGFVAVLVMENSSREKGNEAVGKSPEFKSSMVAPSEPIEMSNDAPTKDTKQILRNLHLQSQYHDEHRQTRLSNDTAKGKVEVLQQYLGICPPSPGSRGVTPSAFSGEKIQSALMNVGAKPSTSRNYSREKSTSPKRQKGSSSPAQKENLKHPSKRQVNIKKPHPYSPEIVQEFMYRKNEERKKKILEEKKSLVQAIEMRNKRLQEVYRKQKEAMGKKMCSDQMRKLIRETASAKESPQCKLEQEQNSGAIPKSSSKAWKDKTTCTLSNKDHGGRNQLLETVQLPEKREALASPAPLESECWFLSPLKHKDLRDCSSPALHTPPLGFSLHQKDAKPYSKNSTSGLSPYRSKEDRVKAIHRLSKELTEKIEMATKRLNAASWVRDSVNKTLTDTTLDLYNESSSVPEHETSKNEKDKTMTIQMLLDTPDPDVLHVSSNREFDGLGRISLVGSTEGPTALDRQKETPAPFPGGNATSKELPWITHSVGQINRGEDLSTTLQGFPVNKDSEMDISLLHEKPITSPAFPPHRSLARSLQGDHTAQRSCYQRETVLKVQNREEITNQPPRESLWTAGSLRLQPSAASSPGAETLHSFEQDFGSLPAEHREMLHNHQTSYLLSPPVNLPHMETCAGEDSGESSEQASSDSQWSEVGRHYGGSSTFCCFSLAMAEQCLRGEELRARHQAALLKLRRKALQEKARAELAWLGHQKSCLENLQDSEGASALATKQHKILTELKQEQVMLQQEELDLINKGRMQRREAEIQHLQNIYRSAHQERKLLLKQQRVILRMQHSTAQLQEKLHNMTGNQEVKSQSLDVSLTRSPATEEAIKLNAMRLTSSLKLHSLSSEPPAHPERCDLSEIRENYVQLNNKQREKNESFSTENKKTLVQYQKEAEESPGLEQSLGVQGLDVSEKVARKVCDATSQTTGSAFKMKDCKNTEPNAQDHVLSPLERADSVRMDEPVSTPITREVRKGAFLESVLEEKAFISNPEIHPKDNENINPCDSRFTGKGLRMLSTSCNLCLVQAENTLQGTGDDTSSLEDLEKESLTEDKRSHKSLREEQDPCSPFQAGKRKEDLSSVDEDGERRSTLIANEATLVPTQLREEEPSEELRFSTDSERKSELTRIAEKAPFETCLSEVKEVEVPASYEIHQVDGSQCLKHLDHISHDVSDKELALKAFSKGLASTESSSKSNNFSLRCGSAKSDSLLSEFQKVSAVWMDISESSISDSEVELKSGEDTDVSIPEEFVCDKGDAFPHVSKETQIAKSNGKEKLPGDKLNEHEGPKDDSRKTSPHPQKDPGTVSDHSCTDNLISFIPSDKANASKIKSAGFPQSDHPAKGMDEPQLDASRNYSRNKTCSQEITKWGAVASSSCSYDIYSLKSHEKQNPSSTTGRVEKDSRSNSLFVDQNRDLMEFPLTSSLKHLHLATDQLKNTVSLPSSEEITNNKLLAYLSTGNLSVSGGKNHHAQLLNERIASSKPSEIVSLSASMPGISEAVHAEPNSFESLQRMATGKQNNSTTERQSVEEIRRELFSSISSKKQLFHAENCSSKGEDNTIFISDEGLPPTDEDTLLEILSPVDEVLSYGSTDLPSSNKKDLSFPSEDLPPPPLGTDAMKNDDSTFCTDDFPSPPEQMTVAETGQCTDEDLLLKIDVVPPLPDSTVPEECPLLNQETTDAFSTWDGGRSEQSSVKGISSAKEGFLEYQQGEHETHLQHLEFLPALNPVSSDQASKSPDLMMEQCKPYLTLPKAEEDSDYPLLSFEIGDRVLVKQTLPGTLMFKGRTCFDSGHWAGAAFDKAGGDHAGTYKGVKYFDCAQCCGIFVRPDETSHLLVDKENSSSYSGDDNSDSYDEGSFKNSEDDKQGGGLTEQKAEDTNSTGGSEVKENQPRLDVALLSGKSSRQNLPHSDQCKCKKFLCQHSLTWLGVNKEKTELTQLKQRILADVLPMKSETGNTDEVNTSQNIHCLVDDQKTNKLEDITSEFSKTLQLETLFAFSAIAQSKYKTAFEKDIMNYAKCLRQEDNQKMFLLKENSAAFLSEQLAKASDVSLCNSDILFIHGCHAAAERILNKFVDDAVKEYRKIKRKHGSKADKLFHSSSETSPATLPFLIKILDAGVFGSSEDFDQTVSDQHVLSRQAQKQSFYKLDQWHSAPWKKTVEVPLVIPHYSTYVKKLSAYAVEELWTPENIHSNFRIISVPKHFECNDLPGNDLETESKRMYNQVIFDLTHELLRAEYQVTANPNTFPWVKENLGSYCSRHLCRRTDIGEVKTFVQGEIIKIMNLEKNDLEMKRKFLNMTKYGNSKRDRVDLILIQELRKEESQWTYYDDDELTVKMRMTEDIFNSLILDTIGVLNKIYQRKACD